MTSDQKDEPRRPSDALQWMRHVWIAGVVHAAGSPAVLLATGVNIVRCGPTASAASSPPITVA